MYVWHVFQLCLKGDLCITKLDHPHRILDVGTGTGIWAIECQLLVRDRHVLHVLRTDTPAVGEIYPSAEVIGTDLNPIQPLWYLCSNHAGKTWAANQLRGFTLTCVSKWKMRPTTGSSHRTISTSFTYAPLVVLSEISPHP